MELTAYLASDKQAATYHEILLSLLNIKASSQAEKVSLFEKPNGWASAPISLSIAFSTALAPPRLRRPHQGIFPCMHLSMQLFMPAAFAFHPIFNAAIPLPPSFLPH